MPHVFTRFYRSVDKAVATLAERVAWPGHRAPASPCCTAGSASVSSGAGQARRDLRSRWRFAKTATIGKTTIEMRKSVVIKRKQAGRSDPH